MGAAKRARKAANANKPKRPASSYWLWLNDNRATITAEVGGKDVAKVAKVAGERWKALPEKAKTPYEKKAEELRAAYQKEMEEYKKTAGADAAGDDDEEEDAEEQ